MHKGVAVGGPRDGIVLTAGAEWDGRVRLPEARAGSQHSENYYAGHYVFIAGNWYWRTMPPRVRPGW